MTIRRLGLLAALVLSITCCNRLKDGEYTLTVLSTNDVHSTWFDSTYVPGKAIRPSLFAVNHYVDSVRAADGAANVLLIDVGDCLQGDNAAYYYNFIDTITPHLFPRIMDYMKYDAIVWGNHDVETGHSVYDRVNRDLNKFHIPLLAGNAIREDNGKPYFPAYKMFRRGGMKVAVLGYENANIKAWLGENLWSGMHFEPIVSIVQRDVDAVKAKEHPDVVIVGVHSGTGEGDGSILESEGLDVFNLVKGVDFVLCAHDHRPYVESRDSTALMNSGSHSRNLAHGKLHLKVEKGKIVSKHIDVDLIPVDAKQADPQMRAHFQKDYEAVKAFTLQEVGILNTELRTRDAYKGMSDYLNLLHTLGLGCPPAEISIAAPLTYNGYVKSGPVIYNDLFTIYPFENQLFVVQMTGEEILRYLEASYDQWIQTISKPGEHVLKIAQRADARTQQEGWSFVARTYNFDSAGGLWYTVDVTKPRGSRVTIEKMADETPFQLDRTYNVAMTSYRASGGGELLQQAGVDTDNIDERVVARYPEIRNILYDYLMKNGSIDPEIIGTPAVIGGWKFVPEKLANDALQADMDLLFRRR
ncbi:MAG: bifunctional metallophosphatase/5'-nucleotidase [Bacteroidales bacterium]|nr:bifunctional metallophosphatase/5'-nucleotidase [Bacteroidales bacterium]MBR5063993.1 bifunctional metallophosphatase/5'-nucleotidase [Bacteroidales bacterium]